MSDESSGRERLGAKIRRAGFSVVGGPVALCMLPSYLARTKRGEADTQAARTMAAIAVSMATMPLWALLILHLLGFGVQEG